LLAETSTFRSGFKEKAVLSALVFFPFQRRLAFEGLFNLCSTTFAGDN
jgi:hypothetical protein